MGFLLDRSLGDVGVAAGENMLIKNHAPFSIPASQLSLIRPHSYT